MDLSTLYFLAQNGIAPGLEIVIPETRQTMHLLRWVLFILFLPSIFAIVAVALDALLAGARNLVSHVFDAKKTSRQN